jgi:hypothetical protein
MGVTMNLKKIVKELTEYAETRNYKNEGFIKLELTGFMPSHKVGYGRNGVSELLELKTTIIEADGILIEPPSKYGTFCLFVNSPIKIEHNFNGATKGTFIKIKTSESKYKSFAIQQGEDRYKNVYDHLDKPDFTKLNTFKDEFNEFCTKKLSQFNNITHIEDLIDGNERSPNERELTDEFNLKQIENVVRYKFNKPELTEFLEFFNIKLLQFFTFTDKFYINPEYINETKSGFEIGWMSKETYNSLPWTLKVEKCNKIDQVKLKDIEIEQAGYYSHDDRMTILSEQVDAAKAFNKRFKTNKNKALNNILKKVG